MYAPKKGIRCQYTTESRTEWCCLLECNRRWHYSSVCLTKRKSVYRLRKLGTVKLYSKLLLNRRHLGEQWKNYDHLIRTWIAGRYSRITYIRDMKGTKEIVLTNIWHPVRGLYFGLLLHRIVNVFWTLNLRRIEKRKKTEFFWLWRENLFWPSFHRIVNTFISD